MKKTTVITLHAASTTQHRIETDFGTDLIAHITGRFYAEVEQVTLPGGVELRRDRKAYAEFHVTLRPANDGLLTEGLAA